MCKTLSSQIPSFGVFPSNFTSLSASAAIYEIFLLTFRAWLRFIPARFSTTPVCEHPLVSNWFLKSLIHLAFLLVYLQGRGLGTQSFLIIFTFIIQHHLLPSSSFPGMFVLMHVCVCVNVCLFLFMFVCVGCFGHSGVDCFCLFRGQPTSVGDTQMNLGNFLSTRSWISFCVSFQTWYLNAPFAFGTALL